VTIHLKQMDYKVIYEPLVGEVECGDQYLVKELPDIILLAVVDGLGHGHDAAYAAETAIATIDANAHESIETIFNLCHTALSSTRGAAISIVQINSTQHSLKYKCVGNVIGTYWSIDENSRPSKNSFFLEGGVVGYRLPNSVPVKELISHSGDTLILATDGIKKQFELEPPTWGSAASIAQNIFSNYRNNKDDGLLLVARIR
jgi:negative regulator of sigma-B (phosphoserine phosphatase)